MRDDTRDYLNLFLNDIPMLDVRAPVEYTKGAFPGSTNIALINDDERHQIGICYKQQGQQAAIDLGNQLVSGVERERRIQAWQDWWQANPGGYLYCFRGGLRSQTTQAWLREAGIDAPLVTGGYKAMRRFLLDEAGFGIVPLSVFGPKDVVGWVRLSIGAVSLDDIREGLARIEAALQRLE